jgi:hypothetical protein
MPEQDCFESFRRPPENSGPVGSGAMPHVIGRFRMPQPAARTMPPWLSTSIAADVPTNIRRKRDQFRPSDGGPREREYGLLS